MIYTVYTITCSYRIRLRHEIAIFSLKIVFLATTCSSYLTRIFDSFIYATAFDSK